MKALERWARAEGNKPTSLATFLLERTIREAIETGKIPPAPPTTPASDIQVLDFIEQNPSDVAIAEFCHDNEMPEGSEERLQSIRDKLFGGKKRNGSKR